MAVLPPGLTRGILGVALAAAVVAAVCGCRSRRSSLPNQGLGAPTGRYEPLVVGRVIGEAYAAADAGRRTQTAGALRHVQLLEIVPGEAPAPSRLRFATSERIDDRASRITVYDLPFGVERGGGDVSPTDLGEPARTIELPFDVFQGSTWRVRPPWRLLEVAGTTYLVVHDQATRTLRVMDIDLGSTVCVREGCLSLEDARARGDGIDLLLRTSEGIRVLFLSGTGAIRALHDIPAPSEVGSVAVFVRGNVGEEPPLEAVVAGWRAGFLVGVRFDIETEDARSFVVPVEDPEPSRLRIAAWGSGDLRRIAVGMPEAMGEDGRVILFSDDVGKGPIVLHDLLPNGTSVEESREADFEHWQHEYGQALRFVADLDGDGLPELAIGSPGGVLSWHVDLIAHGSGESLRRLASDEALYRIGTNLSIDEGQRFVLTGGGYVGWPEALESEARAVLFDLGLDPGVVAMFRIGGR